MITRIEIDGFKTFENFGLDLGPMTAVVGPNASGKSNLFDALRFLSLLAQVDIRTAMQGLRGEPEELFRRTAGGIAQSMSFAIEVYLGINGVDAFGTGYRTPTQRLRYEVKLALTEGSGLNASGIFVRDESCRPIARREDRSQAMQRLKVSRNARVAPFIRTVPDKDAIEVRQDGRQKHGRPISLSLKEASRTALSTITTAEFPHLYALRDALTNIRFLEINPRAAGRSNDRFENRVLRSDASNLAAVLANLRHVTGDKLRPDGVLSDIAAELASLIPSVRRLRIRDDAADKQYSFSLEFEGDLTFSSRVISDGTLRLLALLAILNDPQRRGTLCFEEPENGVHEGRVPMLIQFLRSAAVVSLDSQMQSFQVLLNTHSPKVMTELHNEEIVAADSVVTVDPAQRTRSSKTRMRSFLEQDPDLFNPETRLSRPELERLLQHATDAA